MPPRSPTAKRPPRWFFALFLAIWLPVTGTFDAILGYGVWQQCRAYSFAETTGTVLSSGVSTSSDGEGDSHTLVVRYRYTVGGQEFTGDRYHYNVVGTNDKSWHKVAKDLPAGSPVTVYYHPADPAEATLTRGPQGFDLFLGNFLVPFNLVGLGMLVYVLRGPRPAFDPADPKVVRPTPTGWQVRLGAHHGWYMFAAAWGGVAFVSVFAIVFTLGFNPPVWVAAIPWAVGLSLGVSAVVLTAQTVHVAVDEFIRELTVNGRAVAFGEVRGVEVRERESESDGSTTYHYKCVVLIQPAADGTTEVAVHEFSDSGDAYRLADWLRERLGAKG